MSWAAVCFGKPFLEDGGERTARGEREDGRMEIEKREMRESERKEGNRRGER